MTAHGKARSSQNRPAYLGPHWRRKDHRTLWSPLIFCRLVPGDHPGLASPLTASQVGLYWLLFEFLLQAPTLVRWDPKQLARTLEISPEAWDRDWGAIAAFFDIADGILTHPVIEFETWRTLTRQYADGHRPDLTWRSRLAPRDRDRGPSAPSKKQRENQNENVIEVLVLSSSEEEPDDTHAREAVLEPDADDRWRLGALPALKESLDPDIYDEVFRDSLSAGVDGMTLHVAMPDGASAQIARGYTNLAARSAGVRHVEFFVQAPSGTGTTEGPTTAGGLTAGGVNHEPA